MEEQRLLIAASIKSKVAELDELVRSAEKLGLQIQLYVNQKPSEPIFRDERSRLNLDINEVKVRKY